VLARKSCTISADKWYASINLQCDVFFPDPKPHGHPIGVDIGLEKFLATSEGTIVKPPRFFAEMQSKLKLLQRRLSRKLHRSKNYEKARIRVARLHHKIDNTRKDFHFKQALPQLPDAPWHVSTLLPRLSNPTTRLIQQTL
jgi:putative transposase